MAFRTKKKLVAVLTILVGLILLCGMFIPPWVARNIHVNTYAGSIVAVMVLSAMFALSFLGKELIALGISIFRETYDGRL